MVAVLAACGGRTEAAPREVKIVDDGKPDRDPSVEVERVNALCVTKGAATPGERVIEPAVRAVALSSSGDAASIEFTFQGDTDTSRNLATSKARRQLGLKLRAADSCNVVYVMWRLDPKPMLDVSVKSNPGKRTHEDCGAHGYKKVKPAKNRRVPALVPRGTHTLRAEIVGDELVAWIDNTVAWRGTLPTSARTLTGPAGLRSDNLAYDLVSFSAAPGSSSAAPPKCVAESAD